MLCPSAYYLEISNNQDAIITKKCINIKLKFTFYFILLKCLILGLHIVMLIYITFCKHL